MLRNAFSRLTNQRAKITNGMKSSVAIRSFGDKLSIPTDKEQQWGRRKEELDAEAAGDVGFNEESIVPPSDAGTKENPILV